jgi:hypothetical protein
VTAYPDEAAADYQSRYARFVATLPERTGRTVDEWLADLRRAAFTDKNQAIDFLTERGGFLFVEASWLERTFAAGGRSPFHEERQLTRISLGAAAQTPSASAVTYRSPREHAARFLVYWYEAGLPPGEHFARDVQARYVEMCHALGWEPRGWNRVGSSLRALIGDRRKQYRDVIVDGKRRRWCTHTIPEKAQDNQSVSRLDCNANATPSRPALKRKARKSTASSPGPSRRRIAA